MQKFMNFGGILAPLAPLPFPICKKNAHYKPNLNYNYSNT